MEEALKRVRLLGLIEISYFDQEAPGSISSSALDFFLVENYSSVGTHWVFLCFRLLCLYSLLLFSLEHSADQDQDAPLIVSVFLYMVRRNFKTLIMR